MTLTFAGLELARLSAIMTVAVLSDEMTSSRESEEVDTKIMYAIMSGCESVSFYFSDKELICLNKMIEIALRSEKNEEFGLCDAIHEKVAYGMKMTEYQVIFLTDRDFNR